MIKRVARKELKDYKHSTYVLYTLNSMSLLFVIKPSDALQNGSF